MRTKLERDEHARTQKGQQQHAGETKQQHEHAARTHLFLVVGIRGGGGGELVNADAGHCVCRIIAHKEAMKESATKMNARSSAIGWNREHNANPNPKDGR